MEARVIQCCLKGCDILDFELGEELEQYRKKIRDFAGRELTQEVAERCDRDEKYPEELRKISVKEGIINASEPWKVLIAVEELCRADPGLGISMTVPYFGSEVLMLFGSEKLKEKYLGPVSKGDAIMGLAVTEPGGGSDVAGIKTTATKKGDSYILNGSKMFITNGSIADHFILLARTSTEEGKRHHGMSVFVVESKSEGFSSNKLKGKMGVRATDTAELILNNVEVPSANLVGEEGKGFYYIMTFFNISRIFVAAQGLGIAQGVLDRLLSLTEKYGKEFSEMEDVQFTIADIATRIEAARLLTYKAASYLFQFKPNPAITSMAKAYASEVAVYSAERALEVAGIEGISGDLERFFRDAKILEIWEGTSEVEKLVITRMLRKQVSEGGA